MEEFVQYVCHTVEGCLLAFDGGDIHIEQETGLHMEGVDEVVELVEFRLQESKPFFHNTSFNRVLIVVHFLEPLAHDNELFAHLVFFVDKRTVHFFNFGFGCIDKRNFVPDLRDVFVGRFTLRHLVFSLDVFFVEFCQIAEIGNAYHKLRLIILSLQYVPQVFDFGFKRTDHHFIRFALFNQLSVVVVAQTNLIAFVGEICNIGVIIFAEQQLTGILQVFNVLISHLRGVKN